MSVWHEQAPFNPVVSGLFRVLRVEGDLKRAFLPTRHPEIPGQWVDADELKWLFEKFGTIDKPGDEVKHRNIVVAANGILTFVAVSADNMVNVVKNLGGELGIHTVRRGVYRGVLEDLPIMNERVYRSGHVGDGQWLADFSSQIR